ncbi:hypothetical protein [Streptomyces hydrogenans]|uniref:hypothetical protein n=1 Tax=Streptomyces hydrogenans TaxID=1873719 RepID=UPI00381699BA
MTAQKATAVIPLAVLLAAGSFLTNQAVNARVFGILGETRTLGSAVNIAAFNVGVAIAPWVSGLVLDAGPRPRRDRLGRRRIRPRGHRQHPARPAPHRRHRRTTPVPVPAVIEAPEKASTAR